MLNIICASFSCLLHFFHLHTGFLFFMHMRRYPRNLNISSDRLPTVSVPNTVNSWRKGSDWASLCQVFTLQSSQVWLKDRTTVIGCGHGGPFHCSQKRGDIALFFYNTVISTINIHSYT